MTELVTFQDLKTFLDLEKDEVDYPDLILIRASIAASFEVHTNRSFDLVQRQETRFIYTCNSMFPLKALPVQSVSQVLIDGQATTDYKIRIYGLESGANLENVEIDITYTGGIVSVPRSLARAALLQTVYEYENKDSLGIKTVSSEGGTVTKPEIGLLKEVKTLLQPFKHPFISL